MPQTIANVPGSSHVYDASSKFVYDSDGYARKRWTVSECKSLVDSGKLTAGKFELIEGDVIFKMSQSRVHIFVVTQIIAALSAIFGLTFVQSQADISIGDWDDFNDPEPDVAVLAQPMRAYLDRNPIPTNDVRLVVEASESTIRGDRNIKSRIYARNGVPEYWIVDINGRQLIVHRQPGEEGYAEVVAYGVDEFVAPLAAEGSPVMVSDLLP